MNLILKGNKNFIVKYKYFLFILFIILVHLLLNNYPLYKITGFNSNTYRYLYFSFTSIIILTTWFYIFINYYNKFNKYFYYTFAAYFIVLFLFSLVFYPAISTVDTQGLFIWGIEHLQIKISYFTGILYYATVLWLTSTIYLVTLIQIIIISSVFAYFTSFASNYLNKKWLILFNCFFVINPVFWYYSAYIQQNIPTNYLIIFLAVFIFKAFITTSLLNKRNVIIIYSLATFIALSRGEAIIIPFACFFIIALYYYKNKCNFSLQLKNLIYFIFFIFLFIIIKHVNPFYNKNAIKYYNFPVYENTIRTIVSHHKYDITIDNEINRNVKALYRDIDYKNIKNIWNITNTAEKPAPNIYILYNNLKEKDLKKTAIKLLIHHPIWYLVAQNHRFTWSNTGTGTGGKVFMNHTPPVASPNKSRYGVELSVEKKNRMLSSIRNTTPKVLYTYHLYFAFFILLLSIVFYKYTPYTALVALLILSSKILIFLTAFEIYYMQYLALYYSWVLIIVMAFIERKAKKNMQYSK